MGSSLAKLEFKLESFAEHVEIMRREGVEECRKVLIQGAKAYATHAAKHTPPWNPDGQGRKVELDPGFYADGIPYDRSKSRPPLGLRKVYDLLQLARNPATGHYRKLYGKLLRAGYYYLVVITRAGKRRYIPCETAAVAQKYVHETYRGLTRAAWGLGFTNIGAEMPTGIRKLLRQRPKIASMAALSDVRMDEANMTVTITNRALEAHNRFDPASVNESASMVAVRTMDDAMSKFFKRKFEL